MTTPTKEKTQKPLKVDEFFDHLDKRTIELILFNLRLSERNFSNRMKLTFDLITKYYLKHYPKPEPVKIKTSPPPTFFSPILSMSFARSLEEAVKVAGATLKKEVKRVHRRDIDTSKYETRNYNSDRIEQEINQLANQYAKAKKGDTTKTLTDHIIINQDNVLVSGRLRLDARERVIRTDDF